MTKKEFLEGYIYIDVNLLRNDTVFFVYNNPIDVFCFKSNINTSLNIDNNVKLLKVYFNNYIAKDGNMYLVDDFIISDIICDETNSIINYLNKHEDFDIGFHFFKNFNQTDDLINYFIEYRYDKIIDLLTYWKILDQNLIKIIIEKSGNDENILYTLLTFQYITLDIIEKYWDIWESNKDYLIAICRKNTLPDSFIKEHINQLPLSFIISKNIYSKEIIDKVLQKDPSLIYLSIRYNNVDKNFIKSHVNNDNLYHLRLNNNFRNH